MPNKSPARRRPKSTPPPPSPNTADGNAVSRFFDHFAAQVTKWAGSPVAFGVALIAVIVWGLSGPAFGYSETWQLVINTGTTIVTFLMVFLIQQSQNKDSEALHLKLDELLIAVKGADETLVDVERLDEDKLLALAAACTARARKQHRQRARSRRQD
ncbi:low affinity iron permease family protein [Achromobacter spanius]|uniref:low affinity iron permease family protein n=1 Tax=Achromobacter spanius TaxID=217203 RepID=UPI003207E6E5